MLYKCPSIERLIYGFIDQEQGSRLKYIRIPGLWGGFTVGVIVSVGGADHCPLLSFCFFSLSFNTNDNMACFLP